MRLKNHEKQDKLKKKDIYRLWSNQQGYTVYTTAAAAV